PFLAEPTKGWLLTRRGVTPATAFAAVVTEYLVYMVVSSGLAIVALWLLAARYMLPPEAAHAALAVSAVLTAFVAAFACASVTGVGLIVPILRASGVVIGRQRALRAAREFGPVEDVIIEFLSRRRGRLGQVIAIEAVAHSARLSPAAGGSPI